MIYKMMPQQMNMTQHQYMQAHTAENTSTTKKQHNCCSENCCAKSCQCFAMGCASVANLTAINNTQIITSKSEKIVFKNDLLLSLRSSSLYRPPILA